jgi:hypothetical protein
VSLIETDTIFGRVVSGFDVESWVLALLRKWSSTYLAELERQHGYAAGTFPRVRGWAYGPTFDKWPEDQLPGVLVVTPGITPPPTRDGDGVYRVRFNVDVGCAVSARTQGDAHEIATLFVAAHAAIVAQRPSLEGHAIASTWLDLRLDPLAYDDTRALYAGFATFAIEVDDVLTTLAGPVQPDPEPDELDPYPLWPLVETHDEVVDNYPTDQPLPQEDTT